MNRRTAALLVVLAAAAGCAPKAPPQFTAADMQANKDLVNTWTRLLMAKKFDSLAMLYTPDASVMPANVPAIQGRQAIQAFMTAFPPVKSFRAVDDTIDGSGGLAYARGRYWMTLDVPGTPSDSGKFIEIRRKQSDGSWKLEVDMFSSNIPTSLPEAPAPSRRQ